NFDKTFSIRKSEADDFYGTVIPKDLSDDAKNVMRQGFAGMLWSKQFYHYVIKDWLQGDPGNPPPPQERKRGRNRDWPHLYNADVISMPDKWEYPWYAAWDLAFHCIPLALVDSDFAKEQLTLMLREWYMHPNGQIPAYEWAFGDVNPPVHAWASWRVYKIEAHRTGKADPVFLEKIFPKLLLTFTWWVNRKDVVGNTIFQGGFLGLATIAVSDRGGHRRRGGSREAAALPLAVTLVRQESTRHLRDRREDEPARAEPAAHALDPERRTVATRAQSHARRDRVPLTVRDSRALALSPA